LTGTPGNAQTDIHFQTTSATSLTVSTRVDNSTRYQWGAQFENNVSFASSYIPTTTAAVVRNADVLTYPFAGNASATAGTAYAELGTEWSAATGATQAGIAFDVSLGALGNPNNVSTTIRSTDGINQVTKTGLTDMSAAVRKRASSWGTGLIVTGDGVTVTTGTFDGAMGSTNIAIGCSATGTVAWFGTLRNVRIWTSQLPDGELQVITT
jgi:hypothetical protein